MLSVTETQEITFSADLLNKMGEAVSHFPDGKQKSALLPILHDVQAEFGWISPEAMDKV
ncbi:MAG: NAD(P)H-dependent oxidoreductase subunit E, partial [Oligoflexus sp.]|nr:NAD(P)H-dependent oxidoreductase subunit E [Pseudopedobacter sp.]